MQVSLTLFAFTGSARLVEGVNANSVRLTGSARLVEGVNANSVRLTCPRNHPC